MLSVTSGVAIGLLLLGWLIKYGLGFAENSKAALQKLRNSPTNTTGALLAALRMIGCLFLWYADGGADGPVVAASFLSLAALMEFSSIEKQGGFAAASSASAVLLACKASYNGSAPMSVPLLLVLVSVCGLTIY